MNPKEMLRLFEASLKGYGAYIISSTESGWFNGKGPLSQQELRTFPTPQEAQAAAKTWLRANRRAKEGELQKEFTIRTCWVNICFGPKEEEVFNPQARRKPTRFPPVQVEIEDF